MTLQEMYLKQLVLRAISGLETVRLPDRDDELIAALRAGLQTVAQKS